MEVTPDVLINDLKSYLDSFGFSITDEALKVLTEYENRCYLFDLAPFYWDLLYPLVLNTPELQYVINKLGGNTEEAIKYLENHIKKSIGINDPYEAVQELYSSGESESRGRLIEICINKLRINCRKTICNLDLLEALLQIHDEITPVLENGSWKDERLHTPFNTLSHMVSSYHECLWVKFDDLKKELQTMFDIAISFAGEDRGIAEKIADVLTKTGVRVFYDKYEQASLWGKNLYSHLNEVYNKRAKFCLMIISKNYANKVWTNLERQAAQARSLNENREYILPLRLDDTEIPGLLSTIGYIDLRTTTMEKVVELLKDKLSER